MVTEFASWPHAWRLVSIGIGGFRYTRKIRAKKWRTKVSQYFVILELIPSNTHQECVATTLAICLFSGLRSSLLCSDHEVCAGTNLCWWYAQTCYASPVRAKWMCKRTVPLKKWFKVQVSKAYRKRWGGLGHPNHPASNGLALGERWPMLLHLTSQEIFNTEIGSEVTACKKKGMSIATGFVVSLLTIIIHLSVTVHSALICCNDKRCLWS